MSKSFWFYIRFEWIFVNSQKIEDNLPKNEDYSTWDVKSVLTNTTGFSLSSVKSSVINKKINKLKSVSQMSRYGDVDNQDNQSKDNKQTIYKDHSSKLAESKNF